LWCLLLSPAPSASSAVKTPAVTDEEPYDPEPRD
jgi:hypothetical protein